jgi:hypothetical protein
MDPVSETDADLFRAGPETREPGTAPVEAKPNQRMPSLAHPFVTLAEDAIDADAEYGKYLLASQLRSIGVEPFPEPTQSPDDMMLAGPSGEAQSDGRSISGQVGQAIFKGLDQGGRELMDSFAFLAGAPVEAAKNVMNVGLEAVGMEPIKNAFGDIDSMRTVVGAYQNAVDEAIPVPESVRDWASQPYDNEILGGLVEGITQFGVAAVPAAKLVKAMTTYNAAARGFVWGAIADFTAFNPDDPTLANGIINHLQSLPPGEQMPVLQSFLSVMAKHETDSELVKRARMAYEGAAIGVAIELIAKGAIKVANKIPFQQIADASKRAIGRAGDAADARIAEREADTGVTLGAGVDPMPAVDAAISKTRDLILPKSEITALNMAPDTARAHKTPPQLLVMGNGEKATTPVTQAYNANNKTANFNNIDQISAAHPQALASADNWLAMQQEAMGGQFLPHPPMQAIRYAQDVELMAAKLRKLTPELKAGVDEGFAYVQQIADIYNSGSSDPKMTADLFVWGILSRGAGPTQQEAAFLDIMEAAQPMMAKVVDGTFNATDAANWSANMKKSLPEGSPGKQVTMNVNAAGALLRELAKVPDGSNQTVLQTLHGMLEDPNVSAKAIRRKFMELTDSAGIDNKVVSFVLLVAGRTDVLVMDRIQGRHLWDDGRFDGFNIYDGYYKEGTTVQEGLQGIFRGPRGVLVTEMLEDGMRPNVQRAYDLVGRSEDASLGRFHWETWVIEGEQVVSHSTLDSIARNDPVGGRVTEGKTDEFASGLTYIRGREGPVQEYPLSDGEKIYMDPVQTKKFLKFIKDPKAGIVPRDFKVTARADIPWYERPEVNREALDKAAREFANATEDGRILSSAEGS